MGRAHQTPFAKPPGEGLSSSTVNVLWGFSNIVIGYLLVCRVGDFRLRDTGDVAAFGVAALLLALILAWRHGRFNGGNAPGDPMRAVVDGSCGPLRDGCGPAL
jgi:hypothetical protein